MHALLVAPGVISAYVILMSKDCVALIAEKLGDTPEIGSIASASISSNTTLYTPPGFPLKFLSDAPPGLATVA